MLIYSQKTRRARGLLQTGTMLMLALGAGSLSGCVTDSFLNPSVVGRWEHTPVTLPIITRLSVIEGSDDHAMPVTEVRPADLIPDIREYIIGSGDVVTVSVFELLASGIENVQTRRVDETGALRLPIIGPVRAKGLSPSQLEAEIASVLQRKGILGSAVVGVIMQESRSNTFSVIGSPVQSGTAIGTYIIPKPNFRLMEALALARGVPERTKKLHIIRQTALTSEVAGEIAELPTDTTVKPAPPAIGDAAALIDELIEGIDTDPVNGDAATTKQTTKSPTPIESGLDADGSASHYVNVGDKWIKVGRGGAKVLTGTATGAEDELGKMITQRIIDIPYDRLLGGDMRYNIIIRPGDVIRVPGQQAGFVYIMGEINRPGAYTIPGQKELTLQRLIASAGNLSQLAIPERVDLTRRLGDNQQAIMRLDLRAIFDGEEPDIFLKRDDIINIGTNFAAVPLAIFRNGMRATYGFGFVIDRNFVNSVLGHVR
jgi:polysaccharide export outer membrane protein